MVWMRANAAFVGSWVLGTTGICAAGALLADLDHATAMAGQLAGCANVGTLAALPWVLKRAGLR